MAKPITLPKSLAALMNEGPDQIAEAERLLQALSNLRVIVQLPDGTRLEGSIQIAGNGATIQCLPSGNTAR